MGNRVFQAVVFLLWSAAMSWLLVAKILPPFFQGDPPRVGVANRSTPVAWEIKIQGSECGVSVSQARQGTLNSMELHSRVKLWNLPLSEVTPTWARTLLQGVGGARLLENFSQIRFELQNQATFDSLGALASFQSRVRVNENETVAKLTGRVRDGELQLRMQTGDYVNRSRHAWRESSILGGQLSPEPKLLGIHLGRRWQEEVYNPLQGTAAPAELLEAKVVDSGPFLHNGEIVRANRVEYRSLSAAGVSPKDRLRAVAWVREDGVAIQQDSYLWGACLRFTRLPEPRAEELARQLLELESLDPAATVIPDRMLQGVEK